MGPHIFCAFRDVAIHVAYRNSKGRLVIIMIELILRYFYTF